MDSNPATLTRRMFDSDDGATDRLIPRWLFLRALGLIYFSAVFSLVFQIRGLIGPSGILTAGQYLHAVANSARHARYWDAPTVVWVSASSHWLLGLCWIGMLAALLATVNIWPRGMLAVCL